MNSRRDENTYVLGFGGAYIGGLTVVINIQHGKHFPNWGGGGGLGSQVVYLFHRMIKNGYV